MRSCTAKDYKPFRVVLRSLGMLFGGRLKFPKDNLGRVLTREDGQQFRIFREIVVVPDEDDPPQPSGVFRVWFYSRTSGRFTKLYSWIATVLFVGLPGFRHKFYLIDEASGELGGIYEWNTEADAQAYADSYAMRLSAKRSVPGKFSKEVFAPDDARADGGETNDVQTRLKG